MAARVEAVERRSVGRTLGERILVLTPTGDDAALVSRVLRDHEREATVVKDLDELAREFDAGMGVALIASEAMAEEHSRVVLREMLARQEPWSDVPVLLLGGTAEGEAAQAAELFGGSAQVVLLERPLAIATFLSAVDAALRSRRRQYEVKRLLSELAASAMAIARAHEDADRAKDEFLATLAHELRSPMTAIRGWIQLLMMGDLSAGEASTALAMIESSTRVQAHIIEDLMDVSRILAGKEMIEPRLMDMGAIIASIVATFRPAAAIEGIDLVADLTEEPLMVWADDVRLQQVGWNLLSNAIKFTPRGGVVRISLHRENASAVFRVSDTGQGIASEMLPHVFDRYRQEEGAGMNRHLGLGLGLAIVRHLVERHGGTVTALSEGRGRGAEFVVTLPLHSG